MKEIDLILKDDLKVEDILKLTGGFSTYQKWITFALVFPQISFAMVILSPIFTGANHVPIYCKEDTFDSLDCDSSFQCVPINNGTVPTYSSIVQEWDLVCSRSWISDTITSFQMAGMMLGASTFSILSDTVGRRKCFILQSLCMAIFGMLPALAFDPWSYSVARFLAGFGCGACFVTFLAHLMEFLTASYRTVVGSVQLYAIGEMLLGLLAYWLVSWRYLTLVSSAAMLFLIPFHKHILESPRWLLLRNRTSEAHKVFATIAKWNSKPIPELKLIEKLQQNILANEVAAVKGFQAVKMIAQDPTLRIHMAIKTLCVVSCSLTYYGVSFNVKNLSGNPYLNVFYMGLFDLGAPPASFLFVNWIGRRKAFTVYMVVGTSFLIGLLCSEIFIGLDSMDPIIVVVLSLCGRFGIVTAWAVLKCIILETAPTNLRSSSLGFTAFAGYLGGIMAPQLVFLGTISETLPYIILCVMTITSSVASWFLDEMLKKPLEEGRRH